MFDVVHESLHHFLPLARFAVATLILSSARPPSLRTRLPAAVVLLMAGLPLEPYGFGAAPKDTEVVHFFVGRSSVRRSSSRHRTMKITPWYASRFEDGWKRRQHRRNPSWAD
jgi:hypothetical protein